MNIKHVVKLELSKEERIHIKNLYKFDEISDFAFFCFENYISDKEAITLLHELQDFLKNNKDELIEHIEYQIRFFYFH